MGAACRGPLPNYIDVRYAIILTMKREVCARRWGVAVLAGLALAAPAFGLDPRLSLRQYLHRSWTQADGAQIPGVNSLAQTTDGYLWLGTNRGILRFDGQKFTAPALPECAPDEPIRALAAAPDGGLWFGTSRKLKLVGRQHAALPTGFGLAPGIATAILEDRGGRFWFSGIVSGKPAFLAVDTRNPGLPLAAGAALPTEVVSLTEDSTGLIWVASQGRVYSCSVAGRKYFCDVAARAQFASKLQGIMLKAVLRDRDGSLWLGTMGQGLFRLNGEAVEHFTERDGLSADAVVALLEDGEGNIWVATMNGLDRFREPKVARWTSQQGLGGNLVTAVRAARNGDLWAGIFGAGLDRVRQAGISHFLQFPKLPHSDVLSIFEDTHGTLWLGTTSGTGRFDGAAFHALPSEDGAPYGRVLAFAEDREGTLWLADGARGLASVRNGRIVPARFPGLESRGVHQFTIDRAGNLWVGYLEGGVAIARQGGVRRFSAADGLASGSVQAFFEDSSGSLWVGTTKGMSRFRQGAWTTWGTGEGLPPGGVQAFAESNRETLWLVTRAGLAPIQLSALDQVGSGRGALKPVRMSLAFYGPNDGVHMPDTGGMTSPRITTSSDGRFWLATSDGLAVLDPKSIRKNPIPPPVTIDQLVNDGKPLATAAANVHIRGRSLEIDYTALSLAMPEALRFRYRLDPLDSDWVDAGARRDIAYAELRPGHYRFRVTAHGEDGKWNSSPASIDFTVDPRFYQTWPFWSLCACGVGLAVYAAHKWRMRLMRARFQIVLQERSRLTREMHDTLLQGFAGVVFQLEAATRQMDSQPDASRARLLRALEQADQSLREARMALSCLRMPELENSTLPEALRRAAAAIVDGSASRFHMDVTGRPRELPYDVQANLFVIAREAVNNAVAHAQAGRIQVSVDYGADAVTLIVRDDGRGFDLEQPRPSDHWGLSGMQERARDIGADLTIHTAPGEGTEVEVVVGTHTGKRLAAD